MTSKYFVELLNSIKPRREEIKAILDDPLDTTLLDELEEECSFDMIAQPQFYDSELMDILNNTNIVEKGIADYCFVSTVESSFAYSDRGDNFLLVDGKIISEFDGVESFVSDSEADFIWGLVYAFKTNTEFVFRKSTFDLDRLISELFERASSPLNVMYFVDRLRESYAG